MNPEMKFGSNVMDFYNIQKNVDRNLSSKYGMKLLENDAPEKKENPKKLAQPIANLVKLLMKL